MSGRWLRLALGVVAIAAAPLALAAWNQKLGQGGFATPVGGKKWFATTPGFFTATGVRDPELSPLGAVYNWTDGEATLRFTRLHRSKAAVVTTRILGTRTGSGQTPEVVFSVDGVEVERLPVPLVPRRVSVPLPPHKGRGSVVSIKVIDAPGVMLENVRLASPSGPLPLPREAMGALAFVAWASYSAALLAGATPWIALGLAFVQATATSWLAVTGGAFLGRYSESLAWLAAVGLLLSLAASRVSDLRWRRVWILVICLATLKLSTLSHPQIVDADAEFQAGNLRRVLSGEWFFTSATPPPAIPFPYPPGLSVAASPFTGLPPDQWPMLLRVINVVTETFAAATFSLAVASLASEFVGAMTFIFLALSPEGIAVLFIGNLANLFADALMIFGCSFLIGGRKALASLSLLGGFLSHFGTLLVGAPLSFLLAIQQRIDGASVMRRSAPVIAALMASFVLYYGRFLNLVADAWDQMTSMKGAAAVGPMTASVTDKLTRMGGGEAGWITFVAFVAMAIGIATWPKDREPLARVLTTWLVVILAFAVLGLLTPIQVRTGLSARPAVAVLCASGFCALWSRGSAAKMLAASLLVLTAIGFGSIALGFFPFAPLG